MKFKGQIKGSIEVNNVKIRNGEIEYQVEISASEMKELFTLYKDVLNKFPDFFKSLGKIQKELEK